MKHLTFLMPKAPQNTGGGTSRILSLLVVLVMSIGQMWAGDNVVQSFSGDDTGDYLWSTSTTITKSIISVEFNSIGAGLQNRQRCKTSGTATNAKGVQLSSSAGSSVNEKYVGISSSTAILSVALDISQNGTTSGRVATAIYFNDATSKTPLSYETFSLPSYDAECTTKAAINLTVPSNCKYIRLYKQVKYDATNKVLDGSAGSNIPSSNATNFNIFGITVTAEPTSDVTPPTLSSSNPANNATDVAVSGTIVLTFSEAIASVDGSKFTLTGATKGTVEIDGTDATKVNIAYSEAANEATVTLATAAGAVSDASSNASAALSNISFTTVASSGGGDPEPTNSVTATWPMVVSNAASMVGSASNSAITPSNAVAHFTDNLSWGSVQTADYTDDTSTKMLSIQENNTANITEDNTSVDEDVYVKYSLTVANGYTFTPTAFSAMIGVRGTGNGAAKVELKKGTTSIGATSISKPNRSGADTKLAKTVYSKEITGAATYEAGDVLDLYIYLGGKMKNKSFVVANVTITGTYAEAVPVTYTLNAAVAEASTGYGTVDVASIPSITSGSTITISTNTLTVGSTTITATPTTATNAYTYAFASWKLSNGNDVPATVTADLDVVANFTRTPKSYELTWNIPNDATITNSETYTHGTVAYGTTIVAPILTRSGYDFTGWDTDVAATMPDHAVTYTAQWQEEAQKHAISYAGYGTADISAYPTEYSEGIGVASFAALADTEDDHFIGWSPASIPNDATDDPFVVTATWEAKKVVTFNSNGGSAVATQKVVSGETATLPDPAPTRLNYDFEGWQLNGVDYDFSAAVTDNITLDAVWTRKAIPGSEDDIVIIDETTVNTGGTLSVGHYFSAGTSNNHVKYAGAMKGTGCRFTTFTIPSGKTGIVKEATVYTAKTFVIIPASDISGIDFDNNTSADATVTYENAYFSLTGASGGKSEDEATVNNEMSAGTYYCGSTGSGLEIGKLTLTISTIVPTVKLKVNGSVTQTITVSVGEKLGEIFASGSLPTIDLTGYTFNGWKNEDGDAAVNDNTPISGSMVIYADLEADEYNVTLENGDTDGAATVHYGDDALTITTPVAGAEDYQLLGFYTAATEGTKVADGEGNLIANVSGYTDANGKWNKTSDATLYAIWQAIDFCYTLAPSASTGDIAAGDEITTSAGGKMTMVQGDMDYVAHQGVNSIKFANDGSTNAIADVELNHKLQEGSVIKVVMGAGGTGSRGLNLQTVAGTTVAPLTWEAASTSEDKTIYYTIGSGNALIGENVFRLARTGNIYLKSLKVGACGNEVFKVSFDLQGHGAAIDPQYLEANALVTTPANPTTTDLFTFGGWYKEATCTHEWDFDNDVVTTATTIYAKWTAIPELEDEYVWKKGESYTGCVDAPNADAAAAQYSSVTVVGMDKMSSGRPSTANTEVTVTIASTEDAYAIKSICTYGKLEEPAGAQISWDNGTTWEALAAYSEGQKSFNAPMAKFPTNFKLKFTGVSTSSGGLWWRNALVTLELKKTQDGDPVESLVGLKVNGRTVHADSVAMLNADKNLDMPDAFVDAPQVSFVKRTTYNFTDATSVYEDVDVDVTATENLSSKWEAETTIGAENYTVTLAIPTDPILTTETTALTLVSSKNKTDNKAFTFSGRNLASNVTISLASDVEGLTISPAEVTPDANGKITEQEVTVTYAWLEDVAEANVDLTVAYSETVKKKITLTYSSTKGYAELLHIDSDESWNWQNAYDKANGSFSPRDVTELLANVENVKNNDTFKAQALEGVGEHASCKESSDYYFQGSSLRFYTEKAGIVYVKFSGTNTKSRALKVYDNADTEVASWAYDSKTKQERGVYVPAGNVTIKAFEGDASAYARIYQVVFDAEPQPDKAEESHMSGYERDVTEGRYGTICLPNGGVMVGAAIFEIAYYDVTSKKIYFDEILNGTMEAGMPYIFLPNENATQLGVFYTDAANAEARQNVNGLYGSYTQELLDQDGTNYILYNNQYCVVNSEAYVGANRAYIKLTQVPNYPIAAPAPGRRRIAMSVAGTNAATAIENVEAADAPRKVLINGEMFIIRGEKMYDATGRLVK